MSKVSDHDWRGVQIHNSESIALVCVNPGCRATMMRRRSGVDEPWEYADRNGHGAKNANTPCVERTRGH